MNVQTNQMSPRSQNADGRRRRAYERFRASAAGSLAALLLAAPAAPAHALYVVYEGVEVVWSNTRLGGGPVQPAGWVQVDVPANFTGRIPASQFLAVSDATVYGTYQYMTWGPEDLSGASSVSFTDGTLDDVHLIFNDSGRSLVISGDPTANALITNSPRPPCEKWPGFDDLGFCGARVAVTLSTSEDPPVLDTDVDIPSTPAPLMPAKVREGIEGFLRYDADGGLEFDSPHERLNRWGPFIMTAVLNWSLLEMNDRRPFSKRIWFTHTYIDYDGTAMTRGGQHIDAGDENSWALPGEKASQVDVKLYTMRKVSEFCGALALKKVGMCDIKSNIWSGSGSVAFGLSAEANVGADFLLDIPEILELQSMDVDFDGVQEHRVLTVPILEE